MTRNGVRWRRRSAFQQPLHPAQLLVAGVTLETAVAFFTLSANELPPLERRACQLLFGAQLLVVALLFVVISLWDPALPTAAHQQMQQPQLATSSPDALLHQQPPSATCAQCRVVVTPDSRHCHACGKCVAGYDHHCVYLNTCIGSRNYPLFVGLLSCAVLLFATYMVVSGYALSRLRADAPSASAATGRKSSPTPRIVLLCVLSLPPLLQLVFMLVLGAFHVYFWLRGISTYEFLHQRQERRSSGSSSSGARSSAHTKQQTVQVLIADRRSDDSDTALIRSSSSSGGESSSRCPVEPPSSISGFEHVRLPSDPAACVSSDSEQRRHPV